MRVSHANPEDRIIGSGNSLHGYPHSIAYCCPRCKTLTDFPQPTSRLDSYVSRDVARLFDLEATSKQLAGTAVEFYCQGCLLPVRVTFNVLENRGESWTVTSVLECDEE